ncbi:mitochondrial carrier [Meira miltonrushii]|uniref:Mitochondrial carrier n=1 Tax=Meira miltonrushii TaxID=1280837 RepID=A0A316V838_9BASI|nr:mitochondrial carrier [Meira miltonrushii]PWN32363.1 mitochondrial carrier [Meira miltonrushii]
MAKDGSSTQRQAPSFTTSLMAGALSGLSVDLLFYPIDTLKTRLQSSQGFWRSGGFTGIYRGIGSVAVGSAPGAACFFVTYESLKPIFANIESSNGKDGLWATAGSHMVAASLAEVVACMIRVPTEVIKSRQQTSTYGIKTSSIKALQAVVQESGMRGLYVGFAGTVGREIPFTCIQFPLYEHLKLLISQSKFFQNLDPNFSSINNRDARSIPTWQAGLAGSIAGSIAAGLTTPLDVVKTRIMLERRAKGQPVLTQTGVNTKILPTLRHIATNEGIKALFSGFIPRTIWIGLGGFVFLGTFEAGIKIIQGPIA